MQRLEALAPYSVRAVFFALSVLAVAGLLASGSSPALSPLAAFGPAGAGNYAKHGWPKLLAQGRPSAMRVLSGTDAARYDRIFRLQNEGDFAAADAVIATLGKRDLLGHVLAARYLESRSYKTSYKDLRAWLAAYADHPQATAIHRMALRRKGKDAAPPNPPQSADLGNYRAGRGERAEMTSPPAPDQATPAQRISQRAYEPVPDLAARYFYGGKIEQAFTLAGAEATAPKNKNKKKAAVSHWTAGLAAWRLGRYSQAAKHFEASARARKSDDWSRAAGAFWAARAHLADRRPEQVNRLLTAAAAYPRTFYGLLAVRALGHTPGFNWTVPELDDTTVGHLLALPAGRRALALVQVGESKRAAAELRALAGGANRTLTQAILALASRADMPEFLYRMGTRLRDRDGRPFDAALYPLPEWEPAEGYAVDRALLFAIMRQESQFRPEAQSPAGARGLMQIMPGTAKFITGDKSLASTKTKRLFEPNFNLSLAQKYILRLLANPAIGGDLFHLAAAYNGGIGNLMRWRDRKSKDPLLFIESIPFRETRTYVERVLVNVWMYRLRLGQETPSLEALAAGNWPAYRPLEVSFSSAIDAIKG